MTRNVSMQRMHRFAMACLAALVSLGACAAPRASDNAAAAPSAPATAVPVDGGATRLALAGGRAIVVDAGGIRLEAQTAPVELSTAALRFASASIVPDGRVLIWGGLDAAGAIARGGFWFDPATQQLSAARDVPFESRAGHAVAVLTDGRLLLLGGRAEKSDAPAYAQLWDPATGAIADVATDVAEFGAALALRADGNLALSAPGVASTTLSVDSKHGVQAERAAHGDDDEPSVRIAASIPSDGNDAFPTDGRIALRFSRRLTLDSLNAATVTLLGPNGPTPVDVVAAEDGRLAFVRPQSDLLPRSSYTLFIARAAEKSGAASGLLTLSFTTAAKGAAGNSASTSETSTTPAATPAAPRTAASLPNAAPPAAVATSAPVQTHIAAGASASAVETPHCESKAQRRGYRFCHDTGSVDGGVFTPGFQNTDGRWRLNLPEPKLLSAADLPAGRIQAGVTSVFGSVRRIDDVPVAHVTVAIGQRRAQTDEQGRFVLNDVPSGHQVLFVDGSSANRGDMEFGQFPVAANLAAGAANALPFTMYLPRITARDKVSLPSPTTTETVVTHPAIPGLEIHIPAGAVLRDRNGKLLTEFAIVPLPVDRSPMPVPENFPIYFDLQPGGAFMDGLSVSASTGFRVVYPNYVEHAHNGSALWYYDAEARGWDVYSKAHVSADGKTFVQESAFSGTKLMPKGGPAFGGDKAAAGKTKLGCGWLGDPVDCGTGVFVYKPTDLALVDRGVVEFQREYNSSDTVQRAFGLGMSHNFGMYIYSRSPTCGDVDGATDYSVVDGDGLEYPFSLVPGNGPGSVGSSHATYFVHRASPSRFYGATLRYDSGEPNGVPPYLVVTLRDGTQYFFNTGCPSNLASIVDRFGNATRLSYSAGLLQTISFPSGRFLQFGYNSNNLIAQVSDNAGRTVHYAYDTSKRLQTVTYPDATTEQYTYTTGGQMQSVQDRRGIVKVTNTYDANRRVHLQQDPDGLTTFDYTLDAGGNITATTLTDARGNVERMVFDAAGFPISKTWAYGTALAQTLTYTRGQDELITSTTDALGRTTRTTYDAVGDVLSETLLYGTPSAVSYSFTYTGDFHQVSSATDPLGHVTTYGYTRGCLTSVTDALGHTTSITCNGAGMPVAIQDALGHTTTVGYVGYDLSTVTDALNRTQTFAIDDLGRVVSVMDPLSRQTRVIYDSNGRVMQSFDAAGKGTSYQYDGNGNLTRVTDPNAGVTQYGYDPKNRRNSRTDAVNRAETWSYDAVGNLTSYTDRKNQVTQYQYDALNRPTLVTYADGSTVTPTFDAGGRMTNIVDSVSGTISRSYDGLDELLQEQTPQGTVTYTYDNAGRRSSMTAATQPKITYTYDAADRLTRIAQGLAPVNIAYDDANRRTSLTLPNGVTASYGYDNADEVLSIVYKTSAGTTLGGLTYTYDAVGQRVSGTNSFAGDLLPTPSAGTNQFDLANKQTVWNGFSLGYDANGDPTSNASTSPATTYTFDVRHRLTQIVQGATTIGSFSYDTFGRRTSKTVNGTTTGFLYDGQNGVQESRGGSNYSILTGLGIDERFMRAEAAGSRYFLTDALGSTVGLVDGGQALVGTYAYESYGEVTSTGSSDNPYQYTGRENDSTGLYYYRARYYSPALKRFISEDPMGLAAGLNSYAYADSDPIDLNDPSGLIGGIDIPQCWSLSGADLQGCMNRLMPAPPPGPHYFCLVKHYQALHPGDPWGAWDQSYKEKMQPINGFSPYEQTAAEHYLAAPMLSQQYTPITGAASGMLSPVYTGLKTFEPLRRFLRAGRPSWDEARSGMDGFLGLADIDPCECQ